MMSTIFLHRFDSRLGGILAALDSRGILLHLRLLGSASAQAAAEELSGLERSSLEWSPAKGERVERQLSEYLEGSRDRFELDLDPSGTDFQKAVWEQMLLIPYGETRTYLEIARIIGRPRAVRAVGQASSRNPIWVVIPCHRVVGSSGSLTGYGGGLPVKRDLLEMEARHSGVAAGRSGRLF